jgi:AraC-like DNA-binding protein
MGILEEAKGSRRILLLIEILEILASDRKAVVLASPGFRPEFNEAQGTRIEKSCTWITQRFRGPITLVQAARAAHMSPPAFSRFFHRATNRTFVHFVNELRIGHACRRLLETDLGVAEIAYDCGYENLSNFNRRFRELRNMTPVHYRKTAVA